MIHSLKIYAIKNINEYNLEEIPSDLHNLVRDFNGFFKIKHKTILNTIYNSDDFVVNFNNRMNEMLELSASHGYIDIVKYLINHGAKINNYRALLLAITSNHLNIVKYIIKRIPRINEQNIDILWAFAYKNNHKEISLYLIGEGADPTSEFAAKILFPSI